MSKPISGFAPIAASVAGEGAVLLKNENEVLPISREEKVSFFGRCQFDYYCCGTGSGGMVNTAYKTNPIAELRKKSDIVNEELAAIYEAWIAVNPVNKGDGGFASEPWFQEEMPLDEEMVKVARTKSTKAVIVIGRTAGEEVDNHLEAGSLLLTEKEEAMLTLVTGHFAAVCVVLNVSNIIDFTFMADDKWGKKVDTLLLAWQGGQEGGLALADLLLGETTPNGKLPDTIALAIDDYPSSPYYGDRVFNLYVEDIYVGYRYFETFAPQKTLYEFGYGLSYTSFDVSFAVSEKVSFSELADGHLSLTASVKNVGSKYSGKEVLQIYYQAPQGKLGQPRRQLLDYQKTKLLAAGESETITFSLDARKMKSYDDSGVSGHKSSYVMEAGDYQLYCGTSVKECSLIGTVHLEELMIVETLTEALAPVRDFTRMKPLLQADGRVDVTFEQVPMRTVDLAARVAANLPPSIAATGNQGYLLSDVRSGKVTLDDFIAQLSDEEMAAMCRGEGPGHPEVMEGTTSAFGSVSDALIRYGIPLACTADGPSGIRLDGGHLATLMPIGTLVAATFNDALVEEMYAYEGQELVGYGIDTLLGPGMNIHRNPRNGRNFEYYSEDPLLSGRMAAAALRGLEAGGCPGTIKHFACNNQEISRHDADSVVSERALREIYLRGFEIAVKEGGARSLMTSYNPLNGHWTASNYDLNTTILRGEWGFEGIIMTDWWAKMNSVEDGGVGSGSKLRDMVRAGNDLYMPVQVFGAALNSADDDIIESLNNGTLTRGELGERAKYILCFLMKSKAMERKREVTAVSIRPKPLSSQQKEAYKNELTDSVNEGIATANGKQTYEIPVVMGQNIFFSVKADGDYMVATRLRSNKPNTAQVGGLFSINDEPIARIASRGTDGKWVKQALQRIGLSEGLYCLRVEETLAHMEVEKIHFIPLD
ncbi:MAG: glycoside hydrolase family 3 C-terminal domain-containing protein [Lachnospiraceae bacterium]|jgi:beta-glucosidase|nr:glycoside hydrolase family 3 C-terminal domain-containing protein [Lachnospiraceae bacterium]